MKIAYDGCRCFVLGNVEGIKDSIDVCTYCLRFSNMEGIFLERREDFTASDKIYGKMSEKHKKVLDSFERSSRNLGVLLSGGKGLGKSMFMKG